MTVALGLLLLLTSSVAHATAAHADQSADRAEQKRYAEETINLSYEDFIARKTDFERAHCRADRPDHNCTKPAPYNAFDWTDDGCSGRGEAGIFGTPVSNIYRDLFNKPCQLHDFGYRNFGSGLTLDRTEDRRHEIDNRFFVEMMHLCGKQFPAFWQVANKVMCTDEALGVYTFVRNASHWSSPPPTLAQPAPVPAQPAPVPAEAAPVAAQPVPAPVPAPQSTPQVYPETPGGPARTWSNYANAGGAAGPVIPTGTTVEIACKVAGFRVQDGNTWWYRVASAPWNNQFYVSADAFYNNGQTSGDLHGTPFADDAVPNC